MTSWPEGEAVRQFLRRASRRLSSLDSITGATAGLAAALVVALALMIVRWSAASNRGTVLAAVAFATAGLTVGAALAFVRRRRPLLGVAHAVERAAPGCRNVLITAAELIDDPARVEPYVGEMVCAEAARQARSLNVAALFPSRRPLITLASIAITWIVAVLVIAAHSPAPRSTGGRPAASRLGARIEGVDVVVTPPTYSGQPTTRTHDPARIDVLAGSRVHLVVTADAASVSLETLGARVTPSTTDDRRFEFDVVADADGFIAIEPAASDSQPGVRHLIGLSVTPDHPSRVKITVPGKDLFLADAGKIIDVALEADDDLGLASLTLRYTRVSGSGERFTFSEGEVPLAVTRTSDRAWTARGPLRLTPLALEAGDMIVYRGVSRDRRPGAPPTESDAFIVEITSPGMVAAEGFSMDDQQDKYALSQQMVILKTERLIARNQSLVADSLSYQSQQIAAEQRAVRAQFVFMMGGELAEDVIAAAGMTDLNEEAEAAGEADLAAGRMANRGRVALVQSIRFMSRANTSLNAVDLVPALAEEKAALAYLQQAFSRTRYLLRALTLRERLDLSRRLTGVLATAARDARPVADLPDDPRRSALRRALAGIAEVAGATPFVRGSSSTTSRLAQSVLAVDPSADALQRVSADLNRAAAAIGRGTDGDARRLLDGAATRLASVIRAGLLIAPEQSGLIDVGRLRGSLSDAIRRARGSR